MSIYNYIHEDAYQSSSNSTLEGIYFSNHHYMVKRAISLLWEDSFLSTILYSLVLYAKYNLHQNISTFLCFVCILCWICVQIVLHSPPRFIIKRSLCLSPVRKRTISCGFHKFRDKLHTNAEISSITLKELRTRK